MGIYSDAELIFGIPVQSHDEDGEPTPFWNEAEDDWKNFEEGGHLELVMYGHYEDPDCRRAVLSPPRIQNYSADCWTPKVISQFDLSISDKALSKANDDLGVLGLSGRYNFYSDAAWQLVASVG